MVISIRVPDDDVRPGLVSQQLQLDVLQVAAVVWHGAARAGTDQVALHLVPLAVQRPSPLHHLDLVTVWSGPGLSSVSTPAVWSI